MTQVVLDAIEQDEGTGSGTGTAIEPHRGAGAPEQPQTGDLFRMVASYAERGITFPIESLERLIALQERAQERNARDAFFRALAAFQAEVGPVPKTAKVAVTRGGTTEIRSRFAPLHVIAEHIRGPLAKHGLMYTWDSVQEGADVEIRCTVRHIDGHSETSSFRFAVKDAGAPGMNGVQIAGSARTYGERYSLIQALGLTTADVDDDGGGAGKPDPEQIERITESQAADLRSLMDEVKADERRFLAFASQACGLQIERVEDIPASAYRDAVSALEQKRARPA